MTKASHLLWRTDIYKFLQRQNLAISQIIANIINILFRFSDSLSFVFCLLEFYLMDFKARFQGKISIITKKGLKHTLFEKNQHQNNLSLSGINPQSTSRTSSVEWTPVIKSRLNKLSKLKRLQTITEPKATEGRWRIKTEGNYFSENKMKKEQLFVDEMMQKHHHLLRVLQKRTTFKPGNY